MPSFGEKLRREREKRSITLDEISQSTKIGTRMLQALEEDRFSQLPGGIFNKGFVRAYAHHLGLDEDQIVADYLEASGDAPPVQPELPTEESVRRIEAGTDVPRRHLPWGLFAAFLLLAALVLSLWSQRQRKHESIAAPASPAPPASQQLVENTAQGPAAPGPGLSSPSDRNSVTPSPIKSTVSPASSASPPAQVTPAGAPARSPATVVPKIPAETTAPPAEGEFVVVIHAHEDSWTTITTDGRIVYSGILSAGDQRVIRGRTEVIVKAGNAGGIDLLFNGKKLDPQGQSGQVRTITFGPGGVVANSPPTPPTQ